MADEPTVPLSEWVRITFDHKINERPMGDEPVPLTSLVVYELLQDVNGAVQEVLSVLAVEIERLQARVTALGG